MSWYVIDHVCGHTERVQICGTNSHGQRERKAEWLASQPCATCKKATQTQEAIEYAKKNGFAEMEGSERQVAWAEFIRAKRAKEIKVMIDNLIDCLVIGTDVDELKQQIEQTEAQFDFKFISDKEIASADGTVNREYAGDVLSFIENAIWSVFTKFVNTKNAKFWIDTRYDSIDELWEAFFPNPVEKSN